MNRLESLANALVELDEEGTLSTARQIIAEGDVPALSVLHVCQQAMRVVGERYERHEYYLEGLIIAGEIFQEVIDLIQPAGQDPVSDGGEGAILLATVRGDIHDIGKNLFASSLRGFGFRVVDLGVDVPAEKIFTRALECRPDVVCLSGLITAAFHSMKATVDHFKKHAGDLGYHVPIVLGGSTVDDQVCRYAGADSWSNDGMEGVRICHRLAEKGRTSRRS